MLKVEEKHYRQMESWFRKLNDQLQAADRKVENRHAALLNVCTNIRKEVETCRKDLEEHGAELEKYGGELERHGAELEKHGGEIRILRRDLGEVHSVVVGARERYDARLTAMELALKELERRISH